MSYPVELEVDYPDRLSRWLNNPFLLWIKWILIIPHLIIVYFYAIAAFVVWFIALFPILFTGRYPRGMFEFSVGLYRWTSRVYAYSSALTDKYPPFSNGLEADYPVRLRADYPEHLSSWLNNPFNVWVKFYVLAVPHLFALYFYILSLLVVWFVALWAILFTGRFPRAMFEFAVGLIRWNTRLNAYMYSLTDQYPPFSGRPSAEIS